jgi:hypothetical protein
VVSEKVAAGAIPVVGAIGGAAVNIAFMQHFQQMARAHFVVRYLERRYGQVLVQSRYQSFDELRKAEPARWRNRFVINPVPVTIDFDKSSPIL